MGTEANTRPLRPGITWRSLCATFFCLLLLGMFIQYAQVIQNHGGALAEQSVSIPGVAILVLVLGLSALSVLLTRRRLLSRPELLCVLYAMLIAAPIMTQGMWHRLFGLIAATPREGNFAYLDAVSDKLWPHGPNLLSGALLEGSEGDVRGTLEWRDMPITPGQMTRLPVLRNTRPDQQASMRLRVPVTQPGRAPLSLGQPHLVSVLVRPDQLGPESTYFVRLAGDDAADFREVARERKAAEVTFLHQGGFRRVGKYGVELPAGVTRDLWVEIGLSGTGELAIHDPKLFDVSAIEGAYQGRRVVDAATYAQLAPHERGGLIVKPERLLSGQGLAFAISGYIPLAQWRQTAVAWSTPILLLLLGLMAVAVIMRRQWIDSERYALPLARIPCALIGEPDEADTSPWAAIWRSRVMWAGFLVALLWGLLRMWAFYNPKVPNTAIEIAIKPYLDAPAWGAMWDISFGVSAILVSICLFFELNVLLSLVLGFFCYRALFWAGEFSGLKVYAGFPFPYEQAVGAYLAYAAGILFFTRKYLWKVFRHAVSGTPAHADELMSYRSALLLLAGVNLGIVLWARWLGVPAAGILMFFGFLLLIGFVAMKLRGECGLPSGYFTPYNAMLFVALLGGMPVFGVNGVMVCLIASGFLTVSVFFLIPGAQLEMMEYGRRYGMPPRHAAIAIALGVLGGLLIGGWVFLSNAYALGGTTIRHQWAFNQGWYFSSFKSQLAQTTSDFLRMQAVDATSAGVQPATWAYAYGGLVTLILVVLRQFFAGFWFHPVGLLVGSAYMMQWAWGSVLVAWAIRATALRIGGAATVKARLYPLAVGLFLGSVAFVLINVLHNGVLQARGIERVYNILP